MATNASVDLLFTIIGEQTVELRITRRMLKDAQGDVERLMAENKAMAEQIRSDHGEPT